MPDSPLVAFLIPFRPQPEDSNLWRVYSERLAATCNALNNQSLDNYIVSIAGHQLPEKLQPFLDLPQFAFHRVDYDETATDSNVRRDRNWKTAYAGMMASRYQPQHYMALDADDLIHCNLVEWLSRTSSLPVRQFALGYELNIKLNKVLLRRNFHRRCGSSTIYNCNNFPLPVTRSWDEWNKMPHLTVPHQEISDWCVKQQITFQFIKHPLVMYVTGYGGNISMIQPNASISSFKKISKTLKRYFGFLLLGRRPSQSIRNDFSMDASGL